MPCYTINEASLDLRKANIDALKHAMSSLGFREGIANGDKISWTNGNDSAIFDRVNGLNIRSRNTNRLADSVKQSYTGAVVQMASKKFGWQVQTKANNQYMVTKR